MWLRVVRDGERVSAWGESPDDGVGIAPHYESEVDVVAPLSDVRAGDHLQAGEAWTGERGVGRGGIRPRAGFGHGGGS